MLLRVLKTFRPPDNSSSFPITFTNADCQNVAMNKDWSYVAVLEGGMLCGGYDNYKIGDDPSNPSIVFFRPSDKPFCTNIDSNVQVRYIAFEPKKANPP